jgi:hypothetical protein
MHISKDVIPNQYVDLNHNRYMQFQGNTHSQSDLSKVTATSYSYNFAMISAIVCEAHSIIILSKYQYLLLVFS